MPLPITYFPLPLRLICCGLPAALSVIETAAVLEPVAVGLNVTLMAQLAPAATVLPQLLVWVKSPPLVPVMPMAEMVSGAVPEFVRVTVFGAVVVPTVTLPKLRFVADRVTAGAIPVPVRLTL